MSSLPWVGNLGEKAKRREVSGHGGQGQRGDIRLKQKSRVSEQQGQSNDSCS